MIVQLTPGPTEVFLMISDESDDLNAYVWNGTAFSARVEIEKSLGSVNECEQCMMVVPTAVAPSAPTVEIVRWREISSEEQ